MKIDWKARFRNKYFWVSFTALGMLLLEQLGIEISFDINGITSTILSMLVLLGIVVDNGSAGLSDKEKEEE